MPEHDEPDPADRWQERLAWPVLLAALVSVPAVFLTLLDEPYEQVGTTLNALSGAVLVGETLVLLWVTREPVRWLREHLWLVGLSLVTVLAVVLALGSVQLLRLLRVFGAIRIFRTTRIVSAARTLQRRSGLGGVWSTVLTVLAALVVAAFVAVVLTDPEGRSRQVVEELVGGDVPFAVLAVLAGLLLGGATFVVVRRHETRKR